MKQTFFKQVFKLKVLASTTMLFGIMFLLHACSEERADLDNSATESIELTDENSMKLMVDGEFERNIASINDVQDGIYKYVIVNAKDESVVHAFTNEDTFKKFDDYDLVNSNMPGVNGNTAKVLKDFSKSEILANIEKMRSSITTKNGDPNEIRHVFDYDWPDYRGGIVGHFAFDQSAYSFHIVIDLQTDSQANSALAHYHYDDLNAVYSDSGSSNLRYGLSSANHIVIKNTNDAMSILYLSTGTNNSGTTNAYILPAHSSTQIPNGNYNSIRAINY